MLMTFVQRNLQENHVGILLMQADDPPRKENRSIGLQLSLSKPHRRSHYTQTKWKANDKGIEKIG
jgi:hypothetical protein